MPPSLPLHGVFVYGTLKRGFCREPYWPHAANAIFPATLRASLFDLGPYPAIQEGTDFVAGELWTFDGFCMPVVLATLDQIEGFTKGSTSNLYERKMVEVVLAGGQTREAFAYFYARPVSPSQRVYPNSDGLCVWG